MENGNPKLVPYLLTFAGYYAAIITVMNVIIHGFGVDIEFSGNMAMLFGAGIGAASKFIKDNKRIPNKSEKWRLSLGCLMISFMISILCSAVVIPIVLGDSAVSDIGAMISSISPVIWLVIISVVSAIYYLALNLIFGWLSKKMEPKVLLAK